MDPSLTSLILVVTLVTALPVSLLTMAYVLKVRMERAYRRTALRLLYNILDEYGARISDDEALTAADKDFVLYRVGIAYDRLERSI